MDCVGMSESEQMEIFRVIAGVLHLGNIAIVEKARGDGSDIDLEDPGQLY